MAAPWRVRLAFDKSAGFRSRIGDWHDRFRPGVVRRLHAAVGGCELALGPTYVSTRHGLPAFNNGPVLRSAPDGPPLDDADLLVAAVPFPLVVELEKGLTAGLAAPEDRELMERLDAVGFKRSMRGVHGGGLLEAGGYYIDQGASQLIAEHRARARSGDRLDEHHVLLDDGTRLDADVVVLVTGAPSAGLMLGGRWRADDDRRARGEVGIGDRLSAHADEPGLEVSQGAVLADRHRASRCRSSASHGRQGASPDTQAGMSSTSSNRSPVCLRASIR